VKTSSFNQPTANSEKPSFFILPLEPLLSFLSWLDRALLRCRYAFPQGLHTI
jgi:hypothetical protein